MTFEEFHNGLRVLLNIDRDEFLGAVNSMKTTPSPVLDYWKFFRSNPSIWFLSVSDDHARAIWAIVEAQCKRAQPTDAA